MTSQYSYPDGYSNDAVRCSYCGRRCSAPGVYLCNGCRTAYPTPRPQRQFEGCLMSAEDADVVEMMRDYGNGFVQGIAKAAGHADQTSLARLKAAFPDLWLRYSDLVQIERAAGR